MSCAHPTRACRLTYTLIPRKELKREPLGILFLCRFDPGSFPLSKLLAHSTLPVHSSRSSPPLLCDAMRHTNASFMYLHA